MRAYSILLIFFVTTFILVSVAAFNFRVDPLCFYNCPEIDVSKLTRNHYYHVAQKLIKHQDAKIIILGSSRGQTTPPLWFEKQTGLKTLNLSVGGAELFAKTAFLNIALENLNLRQVIWFADYFELITTIADVKIRNTTALRKYLNSEIGAPTLKDNLRFAQGLIDHNTLEASFYALTNSFDENRLDQGVGSGINFEECLQSEFKGSRTEDSLKKEIGLTFDTYTRNVLEREIPDAAWTLFQSNIEKLKSRLVDVQIVIPPYHPDFTKRLKESFPLLFSSHQTWVQKIKSLESKGVRVHNYFEDLPTPDSSPKSWDDGVHFTCRASMEMLKNVF